jgi:hypothetical protein
MGNAAVYAVARDQRNEPDTLLSLATQHVLILPMSPDLSERGVFIQEALFDRISQVLSPA